MRFSWLLMIALLCFAPMSVHADDDDTEIKKVDLLGHLDLAVPDNALFTLIGSSPETVIRPKVGNTFSASFLPQAANALGEDNISLGIEFNPGSFAMPERYNYSDFNTNTPNGQALKRAALLSKFTLSAAAVETTSEGKVSKYGIGLNFTHDSGSPLSTSVQEEYQACLRDSIGDNDPDLPSKYRDEEIRKLFVEIRAENPEDNIGDIQARAIQKFNNDETKVKIYRSLVKSATEQGENCTKKIGANAWNRTIYGGGVAVVNTSVENEPASDTNMNASSSTDEMNETGVSAWASVSKKMGQDGQLVATVRYANNVGRQREENGMKINETYDGWQVGTRYVHQLSSTENSGKQTRALRGFAELAIAEEKFGGIKDQYTQAGIGLELKLSDNLYFQAIVGDTFDSKIERGNYLSGQLKWSFSGAPAS